MAYPFQTIPHKEYPNTFLENTAVTLISRKWNGEFNDNFTNLYPKFVERFFGLKKDAQLFKETQEVSMTAPEDEITFTFRPDKANLRVGRKKYHTFVDNIIPELLPLKDFMFGVMERESIENVMVRKLNIFPIQADSVEEVKENTLEIYKYIYNIDLLGAGALSNEDLSHDAPWILDFRKGLFSNSENEVTIRIAIARAQGYEKTFNVVLDSSARCVNPSEIGEGAVDRILLKLNDQLFDAYHWCVGNEIIQLMEKENKG
ncbi:MAG: hypothetical protein K2M96_04715 [Prevotella sp.]|nr:hypothetical protein [Prevotella sp.]